MATERTESVSDRIYERFFDELEEAGSDIRPLAERLRQLREKSALNQEGELIGLFRELAKAEQ